MKNTLPEGFIIRPARMDDLEAAVDMFNAASRDLLGSDEVTLEDYINEWNTPGFNLENDTRVVMTPDLKIVGCSELWDLSDPHTRLYTWGRTHPDYRGLGIGTTLLNWAEERARQAIPNATDGARVVLHAHALNLNQEAGVLFCQQGFLLIRHSLRMRIDLNGNPPEPRWPEGIQVRTMRVGEEVSSVVQAMQEAFRDHWGFVEIPLEEALEHWQHFIDNDPKFDSSLWFLAMDGDEIVGLSLCWPRFYDDPHLGWVNVLGVRRPWRRRGIALALLYHSFCELYRRGIRKVGLGVDAQNLTGATRLYQKAGMHSDPKFQLDLYEKEIRPGVELSTQNVEL